MTLGTIMRLKSHEISDDIELKDKTLIKIILSEYDETISFLASRGANGVLDSDCIEQSEILFKHIISTARSKIYIYTKWFDVTFYSRPAILHSFRMFLEKEGADKKVFILCENNYKCSFNKDEFYNMHPFRFFYTQGKKINNGRHFIATDSNSYLEECTSNQFSGNKYKAKANFNNYAKSLVLMREMRRFIGV